MTWPTELIVLQAPDRASLAALAEQWREAVASSGRTLASLAEQSAEEFQLDLAPASRRLAIIASDVGDLESKLERGAARLNDPKCRQIRDVGGIYFSDEPLGRESGVGFLFPGEGAQYLGMLADLAPAIPDVAAFIAETDYKSAQWTGDERPLSRFMSPVDPEQKASLDAQLRQLDQAMFSVLVADTALYLVIQGLGVTPSAAVGHSAGELVALLTCGALVGEEALPQIAGSMARLEAMPGVDASLLAVGASRDASLQLLDEVLGPEVDGQLPGAMLAMDNCPHQTVIVGLAEPMARVEQAAQRKGLIYERLDLARPYHTPLFDPLMQPLHELFSSVTFQTPSTPVYSCTTAEFFPADPEQIRQLCLSHWRSRVEFSEVIRRMHDDGVRVFVEVGPRGNLCSFTEDILRGRPFLAVPMNLQRRHGLTQLQHVAGQLAVHAVPVDMTYFFQCRQASEADAPAQRDFMSGDFAGKRPSDSTSANAMNDENPRGVMQRYWEVMEDFLDAQRDVMQQFLHAGPECWQAIDAAQRRPAAEPLAPAEPHFAEPHFAEPHFAEPHSDDRPAVDPFDRPLMGEVVEHEAGQRLVMRRALILEREIYADDHTVGGRDLSKVDPNQHGLPIMPMTFTVEMMAEAASALFPELLVRQVKNIQLMRWLAFYKGDPTTIEVTATHLEQDEEDRERGEVRVLIQIRDLGRASSSDPQATKWLAAVGTAVLGATYLEPPAWQPFDPGNPRPCEFPLPVMYNNLFHGPLFQGVESLDVMGDAGLQGTVWVQPRKGLFSFTDDPQFIGDPVLLDVAMHPQCAWHLDQPDQTGRITLPYELKSLDFFGPRPPEGQRLISRTMLLESTPRQFTHTTEAYDLDGRLWARINQFKLWRFYLPFHDVNFHGPKDIYFLTDSWPEALPPQLAEPQSSQDAQDAQGSLHACCVRLAPIDDLKGTALLGAAARVCMSPAEWDEFQALERPDEQKPQWFFGRIAAKDAARIVVRRQSGERPFMADVEISVDAQGRPHASPRGVERPPNYPTISISHTDGLIAAMAADHPWVGIDVERIAAREAGFEQIAFDAQERGLLDAMEGDRNQWVTRCWCAKEAVAKAVGHGLVDGPRSLRVTELFADGKILVQLGETLAAAVPQFRGQSLIAWTRCDKSHAVATTLCWQSAAADTPQPALSTG